MKEGYKKTELGCIPEDWDIKKIGECAGVTKLAGFEFTEYIKYIEDGDIIALRALNLKNGKLDLSDIKKIQKSVSDNLKRSKLYKGDVLFSYVGTVGEVALIEENDKYHLAPNVAKLTFFKNLSSRYAIQYLRSSKLKAEIQKYITTTSQPALSMANIREMRLIIPPLKEQEKIADILSNVDSQIDDTDKLIEKTKELKKGLMQRLLTKGIGHTEFKKTEVGEIPMEWEVKKLRDIVDICYGKSQKDVEVEDGKYKILGTGGVIGYTNDFLWDKASVLIGRKGTIDRPQYIDEPFWTVDTLFYTKLKEKNLAKWLYYYLSNIDLKKYNEATGVPSLSVANLNLITIATPLLTEQEKIVDILLSVDIQIEEYESKKRRLEELKKGLMQQLLTGKIRVK